jgi:GTP-binding protein
VAFAGRSIVGKSSLINRLVNRKKLVRTSSRPGCTQQINFFSFNHDSFRFIDLPGYGYAKAPLSVKAAWGSMIEDYLRERESLRGVVVLFDVRRELGQGDISLLAWLRSLNRPFLPVVTKIDKFSRNQLAKSALALRQSLAPYGETPLLFSALNGAGVDELWAALAGWLSSPASPEV